MQHGARICTLFFTRIDARIWTAQCRHARFCIRSCAHSLATQLTFRCARGLRCTRMHALRQLELTHTREWRAHCTPDERALARAETQTWMHTQDDMRATRAHWHTWALSHVRCAFQCAL